MKLPPKPQFDETLYYYDEKAVKRVLLFWIKILRHIDGKLLGQPIIPVEWIADMVANVWGVKVIKTGKRRYKIVWIEIPRKNFKSFAVAGLSLYELCLGEHRGEIICGASNREQAGILFDMAADMVRASPYLNGKLIVGKKEIYNPENNSTFWVACREGNKLQGPNPSLAVLDEVHVQPDSQLWDAMVQGQTLRSEPILFGITTAGTVNNDSFAYQKHCYAEQVVKGIIPDDKWYVKIYGLNENDDWRDPENWKKANPVCKEVPDKFDAIADLYKSTLFSKTEEWAFRRFTLNQWLSNTSEWIPDEYWMQGKQDITIDSLAGCDFYAGIDLSQTKDLTSVSLACVKDDVFYVFNYNFVPEENIEARSKGDNVPYKEWVEKGYITATPGKGTDYDYLINKLIDLHSIVNIRQIGIDPWGTAYFSQKLRQMGNFNVEKFPQNMGFMSGPTKLFERLILHQKLVNDGNPVLRWAVSNVVLVTDANGNVKPDKSKSKERIDPAVASIIAVELASNARLTETGGVASWE